MLIISFDMSLELCSILEHNLGVLIWPLDGVVSINSYMGSMILIFTSELARLNFMYFGVLMTVLTMWFYFW